MDQFPGSRSTGLFEDLREDAGRFPDTMDQRHGAWARLLSLFRLIHDGAAHAGLRLPPRHGRLFHPDAHAFLEGRPHRSVRQVGEVLAPPRVSDGVVFRVLQNLLLLDGDRISYRALDVEQIGSVYEAMMGFSLETATGASIGLRPEHVVVDLEELLAAKPAERAKALEQRASAKLAGQALEALRAAKTVDELVAALAKRVSPRTPRVLPTGALYLQPTEERRRSGSHYTPRSLTEPIVRTTLAPLLEALGPRPRPEAILALRVCDPAMGSGAFLVETCRFLGEALANAWEIHGETPAIPPDETRQLFAQRLVAQQCLYGVDKNPFAVDLAKLSLWLATLARDHPFTFLDHALRCGDSLVGLSREAIASFHWDVSSGKQIPNLREELARRVAQAVELRTRIQGLAGSDDTEAKASLLRDAEEALEDVRLAGDLVVASFFGAEKTKARETLRKSYEEKVRLWLGGSGDRLELEAIAAGLREGERPIPPFHWEIEFPEVFARSNPGFDAFVGNPPFGGKNTVSASSREGYLEWLQALHEESHGNADLVAHFYRRAHEELRENGAFGLIATNTIAQGDTRSTGLRWICTHGGTIHHVRKRVKWPGEAAVVVSVVHVAKGKGPARKVLNGREVERITAFLFHDGGHEDPARLVQNAGRSFIGSYVLGMGFTFDDENPDATPIAEMERLTAKDPRNRERIFPYIGGEELNDSPTHAHSRYVINFGEMSEAEARKWPNLMTIVEEKVRPQREEDNRASYKRYWWQYAEKRSELYTTIAGFDRVLVNALYSPYLSLTFLPSNVVFSNKLNVTPFDSHSPFCVLQSRVHEIWARFFSSSLKDDLAYAPSDCFETFPFPEGWESNAALEEAGRAYYEFRAALMVRNDEGLTKTYNRFHDPDETSPEIARLRELHAAMDRAVLDAYGWTDLRPECKFLLDYEEEEDEDDSGRPRRRRKPWRLRWPDELRDEVLARLLALNAERAAAEAHAGPAAEPSPGSKPARKGRPRKKHPSSGTRDLFDE